LKRLASPKDDIFWKRAFEVLCVILLILTAGQFYLGLSIPFSGMDYRDYYGAVQSLNHGEDPYFLLNINQYSHDWIQFNYPPHILLFFWCLQVFFVFQNIWIYYAFLSVFLVASGYLILKVDKKPEYLFFITLLLTGFSGTFWNFYDGNKDILFLFLFACIFYLILKEKFWQSSIVMGLTGSISLITIPFIALYLVVKRPLVDRAKYILLSIGVIAVIFLITWLLTPSLLGSYIENVLGIKSPMYEKFDYTTPAPFLMFGALLKQTNGISIPLILVYLIYICLIIGASWFVIKKNQENTLVVYSFVMLAIFMLLPRIKPYDFIILVLPLYFLFRDYNYKVKILVFTVISLVPLFFLYYPFIIRFYTEIFNTRLEFLSLLLFMIWNYAQTVCLFLIFGITVTLLHYRPVPAPVSHS
jgi:hypothetical protein